MDRLDHGVGSCGQDAINKSLDGMIKQNPHLASAIVVRFMFCPSRGSYKKHSAFMLTSTFALKGDGRSKA
jgi:hypothetical protein